MSSVTIALTLFATVFSVPLAAMLAIFVTEVALGLFAQRVKPLHPSQASTVIVVPAHNEALMIGETLQALVAVIPQGTRILVVADNCSDATATVARTAGVDVIERTDPALRGKGYALSFAREALRADPPQCVIIFDADCRAIPRAIGQLRDAAVDWKVPVQSTYLLDGDLAARPMTQISNFAFLVKNLVRQRGSDRIGHVAILGGTGMAIPWDIFDTAPLASSDLVEDLSLGIYAVQIGRAPRFLSHAGVRSVAAEGESALTQRTRWEHGFIDTARKRAGPLLLAGLRTGNTPSIWMALHLFVPPLAMLVGLAGIGLVVLLAIAAFSQVYAPALVVGSLLAAALVLVLIAWWREGRAYLGGRAVMQLPLYLLWKLPIYLKLVGKRESEWKRTKRAGE